jgi:hypothetical protein
MIIVGASWLFYWLMVDTFEVEAMKAALVTGFVFILVGLLFEFGPRFYKRA